MGLRKTQDLVDMKKNLSSNDLYVEAKSVLEQLKDFSVLDAMVIIELARTQLMTDVMVASGRGSFKK